MNNEVTPFDLLIWTSLAVSFFLFGLTVGTITRDKELYKRNTVLEEKYNVYWDEDCFRYKNKEVKGFQEFEEQRR